MVLSIFFARGALYHGDLNITVIQMDQKRVNDLLKLGRNASENDNLPAAATAPEDHNADMVSIQSGIADMENGRLRSFAEFDAAFRERNRVQSEH